MKTSGIYSIDNIVNGKSYIGSSNDIRYRWNRHLKLLHNNCHNNHHLQKSYNKYGEKNFSFQILEEVPQNKLKTIEQQYLDVIRVIPFWYYNINYDADRINYTSEVLKKMSDVKKGKHIGKDNPFYGKKHSKETKQKIREIRKNQKPLSNEARKKLSIAGQNITDETRKKMSDSNKNAWLHRTYRQPKTTDNNIYTFKNKITNEVFTGRRVDFYKKYNLSRGVVAGLIKRIHKSVKNWVLL